MTRMPFNYSATFVMAMITSFLVILWCVEAYAQLADTMLCADESCSETISQGEARLAYRPKDDKFLHLNKGEVVLVKSKNAGKKTHLWGGEDFLKDKISTPTDNPYSRLVGENQKITFHKSKKKGIEKSSLQDEKNENAISSSDEQNNHDETEHHENGAENNGKPSQDADKQGKRSLDDLPKGELEESKLDRETDNPQKDAHSSGEFNEERHTANEKVAFDKEADVTKAASGTLAESDNSANINDKRVPESIPADIAALLGNTDEDRPESDHQSEQSLSHTPEEKKDYQGSFMSDHSATEVKSEIGASPDNTGSMPNTEQNAETESNEIAAHTNSGNDIQRDQNSDDASPNIDEKEFSASEVENGDTALESNSVTSNETFNAEEDLGKSKSSATSSTESEETVLEQKVLDTSIENEKNLAELPSSEVKEASGKSDDIDTHSESKSSEGTESYTKSETEAFEPELSKDSETRSETSSNQSDQPKENSSQSSNLAVTPITPESKTSEEIGASTQAKDHLENNEIKKADLPNAAIDKQGHEHVEEESAEGKANLNLKDANNLGQVTGGIHNSKTPGSVDKNSDTEKNLRHSDEKDVYRDTLSASHTQDQEKDIITDIENPEQSEENIVQPNKPDSKNDQIASNNLGTSTQNAHLSASQAAQDDKKIQNRDLGNEKELEEESGKETITVNDANESTVMDREKMEQDIQEKYPDSTTGALVQTADSPNFPPTHLEDSKPVDNVKLSEESDSVVVETASKLDHEILEQSPHLKKDVDTIKDNSVDQFDSEGSKRHESTLNNNDKTPVRNEADLMKQENTDETTKENADEMKEGEEKPSLKLGDKSVTELNTGLTQSDDNEQTQQGVEGMKHELDDKKLAKEIVNESEQDTDLVHGSDKESQAAVNEESKQLPDEKAKIDAEASREQERKLIEKDEEYSNEGDTRIEESAPSSVSQTGIKSKSDSDSNTLVKHADELSKNKVKKTITEDGDEIRKSNIDEHQHQLDSKDAPENLEAETGLQDKENSESSNANNKSMKSENTSAATDSSEILPKEPETSESVLQVANLDNKKIHDPPHTEVKEKSSEQYNALHEGEVVDWNEMIGEKVAEKKTFGWDESLEGSDDVSLQADHQPLTEISSDEEEMNDTVAEKPTAPSEKINENEVTTEDQDVDQADTAFSDEVAEAHTVSVSADTENTTHEDVSTEHDREETPEEKTETETVEHLIGNADVEVRELVDNKETSEGESELHVESFWLRLLLGLSRIPADVVYILEPLLNFWVSLLPEEYQSDVHGVSWKVIVSTLFIGFILIWLMICRSKAVTRKRQNEHSEKTIKELRSQLENMSQEKIAAENELRTKQNEVEIQREEINNETQLKQAAAEEKQVLEQSLAEYNRENADLKRDIQTLTQESQKKDDAMQEVLNNSQQVEKSLVAQKEAIAHHEENITKLQTIITEHENHKQSADVSAEKLKERMKMLEKTKGETKKEGKILKDQIDKMNTKLGELQGRLNAELEENEAKKQEIDILKDCILQFKGAQEYLTDDAEDVDSEQAVENQKEKLKSLIDVANVKATLRQTEAEKLQVTYELEAERKSRLDIEGKVSELEATIKSSTALHNKLEKDKQMLDSKLTVMQEFYAKREVEIQSKLGLEQSKRESNASMLEDQQQKQLELLQQLDAYKKMSEEAKHKYEDAERQHKQEVLGFEKKSHENWLACRSTERKLEEATKKINQLHLELSEARHRLQDREPIIRPRPERHGPPGAPPPFGPPLRNPPPPGSPLHFRNGPPPEMGRRSPPQRRPPSPGGSIPGDRPPSRPDRPSSRPERPPSAHSLPPMDRRPPPGPPFPNTPNREYRSYREGVPPGRPPMRDMPPQGRPGPRMPGGPMNSSPYMERPPIPPSQSPGNRSLNYTQSTLHATPPQNTGDGLRNDGLLPPPNAPDRPPLGTNSGGQGNPFRRGRP